MLIRKTSGGQTGDNRGSGEEKKQGTECKLRKGKEEKWEKTEKHRHTFLGPLISGLVLIILGAFLYFLIAGGFGAELLGALLLVIVGAIIIAFAVYSIVVAGRRHSRSG